MGDEASHIRHVRLGENTMSETERSTGQKDIEGKYMFWFGVIFTAFAPIVIWTIFENTAIAWIAALCGAFITFMSKINDIAELSAGPVRAKMRETIQDANATIEQVRQIARSISETTLAALMAGNFGFQDGLTLDSRLALHDDLINSLREIGVPDKRILKSDKKWRRGIGVIYHRAIAPLIDGRKVPHQINVDATVEQKQAREGWDELLDFDQWKAPTPDEMSAYLTSAGVLTHEMSEWIDDYRHYLETGEIRRRELFVAK